MFVINPEKYSVPAYRLGPFRTSDIAFNHKLNIDNTIDTYFSERFGGGIFYYTINGRSAIDQALSSYSLKKTDVVTILTTSGNKYIAKCVTDEIEKTCQWNREIVPGTKVILVNHEFGFIHPEMDKLITMGIPIIEDCCTTFFSQDHDKRVGKYGDFAVYSFPKIFPIQIGGLLVNNNKLITAKSAIEPETLSYIKKVLSYHILQKDKLMDKRSFIYEYGIEKFRKIGFTQRFDGNLYTVPYAILLNNHGIIKDLPALKSHLWKHGIQSSVFYGEDAFFLPSHQNLSETDVDYFVFVVNNFINHQ
ncbi:MAG: DegT/DnrJ/EryC1/StrS aminotransferase family protein [Candidatus Marinimicrobia bacterium]|nr:DegT/DnrJ/EryC1/StrS aminotransferase family protein [Candidatus Neomarinimicrobiota bacterium]